MGHVKAMALTVTATVASTGSEQTVDMGHDTFGDSSYWIDIRSFVRCSVFVEPDSNSTDITIEGKRSATAAAEDALAATTVSASTNTAVWDASSDAEKYAYIRILENGTASDSHTITVLAK